MHISNSKSRNPLIRKEFLAELITLESLIAGESIMLRDIQRLLELYTYLMEYYDQIEDPVSRYFQERTQVILSTPNVLRLLQKKDQNLEESEIDYKRKLTFSTIRELRYKKLEFHDKVNTGDLKNDSQLIGQEIKKHEGLVSVIKEHLNKEKLIQETDFEIKMRERKKRHLDRTISNTSHSKKYLGFPSILEEKENENGSNDSILI